MKKTFGLLMACLLASCSRSNEPVIAYNAYSDFSSFQKDFAAVQNESFVNQAFNPEDLSEFDGFIASYYTYGLCSDRPIHFSFGETCSSFYAMNGQMFLISDETSLFITLQCNTVKTYASVHQNTSVDSGLLSEAWQSVSNLGSDGYYPPEMKRFVYDSETDFDDFAGNFIEIANGDGGKLAITILSKGTDSKVVAEYASLITSALKSFETNSAA